MTTDKGNIAIIGGGAAGLAAAVFAAESGGRPFIIEKNDRVGKKLRITGKGRCNVTNNSDVNTHIANILTNPRFMYGPLSNFTPADTMAFFERLGVPLKTERGQRVFPVSDNANDIVGALKNHLDRLGVKIVRATVDNLLVKNDGGAEILGVSTDQGDFSAGAVILATGGLSYPLTGSTGDGYRMAEELGHTIIQPTASLVPLECEEKYVRELMGLSLRNVRLSVFDSKGRDIYSEQGEMLFTHFGVSGPLVLTASGFMKELPAKKYKLSVDLKPALSEEELDRRVQGDFSKYSNKDFTNSLGDLLPLKLIPVIIQLSGIDPRKKVNLITKAERMKLVELIRNFPVTAVRKRPIDEAIITSGGVSVREISPKTMESKKVSGLYFAGEVIDVDACTGGFNLQIAFSTAYAAAMAAVERCFEIG